MKSPFLLLKRKMGARGSPVAFYGTGDLTLSCRKSNGRVFRQIYGETIWERLFYEEFAFFILTKFLLKVVFGGPTHIFVMKLFYRMRFIKFLLDASCSHAQNWSEEEQFCNSSSFSPSDKQNNAIEELLRSLNMAADKLHGLPPR